MRKVVAIGGLGGSGTRAVAKVLQVAGSPIGVSLNHALDNIIFTQLFKNPDWHKNMSGDDFKNRYRLFKDIHAGRELSKDQIELWKEAAITNVSLVRKKPIAPKLDRVVDEANSVWGWKEPNTHIYLPQLLENEPNLYYIHVIRNGLDMAFAKNLQQMHNWGNLFGIDGNMGSEPSRQLQFWMESTRRVLQIGKKIPDRFLVINLTELCEHPESQTQRILNFLDLKVSADTFKKIMVIPTLPESHHRYKNFDLGQFNKEQLDFVEEMGFKL